jgi:uncharacterized small protein (DUF1192 family)
MNELLNRCAACEVHRFIACKNRDDYRLQKSCCASEDQRHVDVDGYTDALTRTRDVLIQMKKLKEDEEDLAFENEILNLQEVARKIAKLKSEIAKLATARAPGNFMDDILKALTKKKYAAAEAEQLEHMFAVHSIAEFESYFENPENMSQTRKLAYTFTRFQ